MHVRRRAARPLRSPARETRAGRNLGRALALALSFAACASQAQVAQPEGIERERRCTAAALAGGDRLHEAFGRGCIAKRAFVAGPAPTASRGSTGDDSRGTAADGVFRLAPVDVFASPESSADPLPSLEQRFSATLVAGNPEVAGGKIRHGAYYAHGVYWGWDPLSFLYYNLRYGLFE